ncbi:MAG: cation:proton antiporter, partial [bacterium]|nr:cation:proton antiporter [bacterium]
MSSGLFELALIFCIAAALSVGARLLKQPLILAYLLTGIFAALFRLFPVSEGGALQTFSSLGVMLLLFLIGLEINYTTIRSVGRVSLILGLSQIVFTSVLGFGIARFFEFSLIPALYIAVALSFSSTIIILKLLSEKRDEHSLYGRISIGFLLVQDFVAILILVFLTGLQGETGFSFVHLLTTLLQGAILFAAMLFLGQKVLPFLFHRIAGSQELLFLMSIAWMFSMVFIVQKIGFSIEMGGFLAGLALANSSEHFQIAARIKPLRDFFILVFFVTLGFSLVSSGIGEIGLPVLVFSLFVLFGNPLIVLIIMGIMGYRKRTSFLTGLTVAQISEFSLVLVALGARLGHLSSGVVALVTAV